MKTPFVVTIIEKVVEQIGAVLVLDPECKYVGHITFKNGKKTVFRSTHFSLNGFGAAELAKDKGSSSFFLNHFGYKVPEGKTFFNEKLCKQIETLRNIDDGFNYAKYLGMPVIVKPLNLSQGRFVTKVYNKREYYQVAKKILQITPGLIVERFHIGNDYRIVVLDQEVMVAYQRIPLFIVGDGESTVLELLHQKQEILNQHSRKIIDFEDFRIAQKLKRQKLAFESVLPPGNIVYLLDNANLSSGGDAVDLSDIIHPDFKKLAINITKDMGLRLAGVDIITSDITMPMVDYTIIEVNGSPGLLNYASLGELQTRRVENLYLKVLLTIENE
ncbi:RimK domain-containing protein ATP-grasp [Tolypothrix tenuis PCC 7101]|uniref:RimK domain-containing protein ATP-grasp n=1 Tax=Tolypothrix tenuis PCC 7101 TaxID=231146 RepID=A0A1Z4MXP5_9CYAN|nr:cyanophycin synthetase [Aulosira sp. FACHB-113]BAY98218.1 RimK domain-containing protein ATP-grasp [Tolypothrix tenuis PCC 7101]BAZ77863.1 RimK domain-containing protein ATP-grasp [Aulosira laxa NIES-50]